MIDMKGGYGVPYKKSIDRLVVDGMSVETLKALLLDDLDNPDGLLDDETRLYLAQTLARKKEERGTKIPEAEASLEQFKREYLPYAKTGISLYDDDSELTDNVVEPPKKRRKNRKTLIRIAAVIAAVVVLGSVSANAMGFDIWASLVDWTNETFGFSEQREKLEYPAQLGMLEKELMDHMISPDGLLPSYLPDGYKEVDTQCLTDDTGITFVCALSNDEDYIVLQYTKYASGKSTAAFEKDKGGPDEYVVEGITHYIMTNTGDYYATWMARDIECSVSEIGSRDELIKIINSVYEE